MLEFGRFVERLLEAEGVRPVVLSDIERRLALKRAVDVVRATGALKALGRAAETEGFLSHALRVIENLKQAAVEPDAFRERAAQRRHGSSLDLLLAAIYDAYQCVLRDGGFYDRIGLFWEAWLICRERRPAYLEGVSLLALDGFDDFTPSEMRLLAALREHVDELAVGLNYDDHPDRRDLFAIQGRAARMLAQQLDAAHAAFEPPDPATTSQFAAQYLLWRGAPQTPNGCRMNVSAAACSGAVQEAEYIARRIKALLLDEGVQAGDIVLAYRNLEQAAALVRPVFAECGIPIRIAHKPRLTESAACAFLLQFLEAIERWPREETAALLASPWLPPADETEGRLLSAAPVVARLSGILEGAGDWQYGLERLASLLAEGREITLTRQARRLPDAVEAVAAVRQRFERLNQLAQAIPVQATACAFIEALELFIEGCGLDAAAATHPNEAVRTAESAALKELHNTLGMLHAWHEGQDTPLARRDFLALLRQGMRGEAYSIPQPEEGVRCVDASGMRNLRAPYVFIAGLNEGEWPRAPRVNAIYSEEDARDFEAAGVPLDSRQAQGDRELALFLHAVAAAEKELFVSWQTAGPDGKERRRSPYLIDLLRLFGGQCVEQRITSEDAIAPALENLAMPRDLAAAAVSRRWPLADWGADIVSGLPTGIRMEQERRNNGPFGCFDGVLDQTGAARVRERFSESHAYSVEQIETYLDCPFRFFVQRVLGIEEIEEPVAEFDARERGRIAHEALHAFHEAHRGLKSMHQLSLLLITKAS